MQRGALVGRLLLRFRLPPLEPAFLRLFLLNPVGEYLAADPVLGPVRPLLHLGVDCHEGDVEEVAEHHDHALVPASISKSK